MALIHLTKKMNSPTCLSESQEESRAVRLCYAALRMVLIGERTVALRFYERAYSLFPAREILSDIYDCLYALQRYDEALQIAERMASEYGGEKILVVKARLKLSTPDEAIRLIEECLDDLESLNNRFAESVLAHRGAVLYYEAAQYADALRLIDRALAAPYPSTESYELKEKIQLAISQSRFVV